MADQNVNKLLDGLNPVIADAIRPHLKGDWTSGEITSAEFGSMVGRVKWTTVEDLDAKLWQVRFGRLIVTLMCAYASKNVTDIEDHLALSVFLLRRLLEDDRAMKILVEEKKK